MSLMSPRLLSLAIACAGLITAASVAQARPPLMPEQMIDACDGLKPDAACTFEMGGRVVQGNCAPLPDKSLGSRPNGKKPTKKGAAPKAPPKATTKPDAG